MSPIRCLRLGLLGVFGLILSTPASSAEATLGEAVRKADSKYLDAPVTGTVDSSPKIVAGGGEEGLAPLDKEISLGPLRVTLTYVEEEPQPEDKPSADVLPEDVDEAPVQDPALATEDEIPLEDIPEEAMLPGEFDLGETAWRRAVVTVYFDDPNSSPAALETAEPPASDLDQPQGAANPEDEDGGEQDAATAEPPVPAGPRVVATLQGPSAGVSDPPVSIQIAELDPNTPFPEVVVSFFTGGAHCCSETHVVASNADGSEWTTLDVGEFDGGPLLALDFDGDGTHEFETRDNAFLYTFACYACSQAPLQVLGLAGGKIKDISDDPRFRPAHEAWLKNMIVGVPEQEVNGFLAGYVGQKIRLGEGKQAWDLMLKYYDRNTDWGLDVCEEDLDESGECPGQTVKLAFPEALQRMLNENGYKIGG
jgi:hypothetical protein